eukprot:TRINITY_DN6304_c0_g1_i2.p1 TRINITY_DN6304_c0_g1~~TRINITY_DN6304_c0_g1_i2.p1  ORF type:complete len:412 (+),score=32.64 TRINITY_DN6304_c0_g1_i2:60-1295(+)
MSTMLSTSFVVIACLMPILGMRVDSARVISQVGITPEEFGVDEMIPDRHPEVAIEGTDDTSRSWDEVQAAILDRLGKVRDGVEENFCLISHDVILRNQRIFEGGIVAVVQKKTKESQVSWRINFHQMQEFRTWVKLKPLDVGSNMAFADEPDVWVVRLTDKTEQSKVPLPNLDGTSEERGETSVSPDRLARFARFATVRNAQFLRGFPVPTVDQEKLIPSLVPQGSETFYFAMDTATSTFRVENMWRWSMIRARFGDGIAPVTFAGGRSVIEARASRFTVGQAWAIRDGSDRTLFTIDSQLFWQEHTLLSFPDQEVLYTIRVVWGPGDTMETYSEVKTVLILKGDTEHIVYYGQMEYNNEHRDLLVFYDRVPAAGARSRKAGDFVIQSKVFRAYASADVALLLVASGLVSS